MASGACVDSGISPVPAMPPANDSTDRLSSLSSSSSSSLAESHSHSHSHSLHAHSHSHRERKSRADRPRMANRKPSASILVPRDHPEIEIEEEEFPPDDARAMSPRRNSADVERLGREARETLQQQAKSLQSSLQALAERIDEVKTEHDKLETENRFLQDYIGGLTRTMSAKADLTSTTGSGKGKKSHK